MKLQKFVPFFAIILGGIITPTMDMVNLFLVAVPIWALYQLGIFLAWFVRPKVKVRR